MASVSGNYTGKEIDKLGLLKELGFKFYMAKRIRPYMVEGAAMNVECKLFKELSLGDHPMFLGEVVEASASGTKPLAYHEGRYWDMSQTVKKPAESEREKIRNLALAYRKK